MQPLIEWIYKYGNQYDINNLWKKISEIINVLDEFVNVYYNLEFALIFVLTNNNFIEKNIISCKCIEFWTNHAEYGITIDNRVAF